MSDMIKSGWLEHQPFIDDVPLYSGLIIDLPIQSSISNDLPIETSIHSGVSNIGLSKNVPQNRWFISWKPSRNG